jgi:4-hydroxy-2-oxoheptanedioate aldolase
MGADEVAMRKNATKAKLEVGEVTYGAIVSGFAPEMVELLALVGFDFVFLDCEHGPMSFDQVEQMVRAAEAFAITPIARVPDHADATLLRFLDRGVQGVIVPHVNTAEQARRVAAAARYFPEGHRGSASGRAHDYNVNAGRVETMRWLNAETLVIPMCEETEAVANLDAILAVPGVDVVHTAASDLTQSMGNPPAAEVRAVMKDVVGRVRAAGKHAGVGGNSPSDAAGVAELIAAGANFITIPALGLLRLGAEGFNRAVAAALADRGAAKA